MGYLSEHGLTTLWTKIKSYVASAVAGKQDALVSGTNIRTVNGNSLLGSGDIEISVEGQYDIFSATTILTSSGWSDELEQTVLVDGVTETSNVFVSAAPNDTDTYSRSGVACVGQGEGCLIFTCELSPLSDLSVNVFVTTVYDES